MEKSLTSNSCDRITVHSVAAELPGIETLVTNTVTRLQAAVQSGYPNLRSLPACIGHSGGKDSVVNHFITNLALATDELPVVHTCKPGGHNAIHPLTLEFLYSLPFPVHLIPRYKETTLGDLYAVQYDGSRASEWTRTDRSADFIKDGKSVKRDQLQLVVTNSMYGMTYVFPMFDWTDSQVWACIFHYNLSYSKEYEYEHSIHTELKRLRQL